MVNSGSLASEGDENAKASSIQSHSTNVGVQSSSSPVTATGAVVHCKNEGDSRLPSEVRAIEPTPAKTRVNSAASSSSADSAPGSGGGRLCCSLPLEKVQDVLGEQFVVRKPRKILCLYCERTFVNANLRAKHIDRCHSTKNNRRVSSRRNGQNITATPCFHCDKLAHTEHTLTDLFRHLIEVHPAKYFGCLECHDRFLNQSHLNDHNGRVHGLVSTAKVDKREADKRKSDGDVRNDSVRSKLRPRNEDAAAKSEGRKTAKGKRGLKMALKRSKRLQAQNTTSTNSTNANKSLEFPNPNQKKTKSAVGRPRTKDGKKDDGSQPPISLNKAGVVNPYPEFDSFFRVKKITDHSIDNLKITSLTFDDVFDKAFFNRIRCNIQENLQHHIDGKLFKNEASENRISNFERNSNAVEQVETDENFGCELSLNAATPAASLLSSMQFGEDPESQIEYGAKPSKKKPPNQVCYKYLTRRKYQASILEHKENRDMSKLDMWTQYAVKKRQQTVLDSKKTPEQMAEFKAGGEYKSQRKREELNRILDRRGPFEDLREEVTKKAALERNEPEVSVREAEIRELLSDLVERVIETIEIHRAPPKIKSVDENLGEIPDYLNLKRRTSTSGISDGEIDKSDKIALICSSQETEYLELPTNSVRGKHEKVELTGEWARARIYVCAACGLKLQNMKQLLEHKNMSHQHVWVQHYEFVGNQSELYRHLSIPTLGKVGVLEEVAPNKMWRRSEARACTKCSKLCNSLGELHRHILECGGDWTWMLARKKCKYRPFGTKSRRKRRGLVKRFTNNIQQKTEPSEKKIYKKSFDGPRPRPSDAETIERMLANLPPKRATRKVMSLKDGLHNQRRRAPDSTDKSANKKDPPADFKMPVQVNSSSAPTQTQVNKKTKNGYRKSLRSLNKVLASRILDTNASLLVKRKLKKNLTNAASRITTRQNNNKAEVCHVSATPSSSASSISATNCDNDKKSISEDATTTAKRMSPRIVSNNASKSGDIKWFFPVRKNAQKSSPKRKSVEVAEIEPPTATTINSKKTRKDTFGNLVRTLSLRSQKSPPANKRKEGAVTKSKVKRLKSSPPILTREEELPPPTITDDAEAFLGEPTGASGDLDDQGPPELEKIVEGDVASVDQGPPAPIVVAEAASESPLPIIDDSAADSVQNDEEKVQVNSDCDRKSLSGKKPIKKAARGLNDCIALLTSKLGNNAAENDQGCSIFKLMPSPPHDEIVIKPIATVVEALSIDISLLEREEAKMVEKPKIKSCILKVPSVVFNLKTTIQVIAPISSPPREEIPSPIISEHDLTIENTDLLDLRIDSDILSEEKSTIEEVELEDEIPSLEENSIIEKVDEILLSEEKSFIDAVELEDELPLASLVKETSTEIKKIDGIVASPEIESSKEIESENNECQIDIVQETLEIPEKIFPECPQPPTEQVVQEETVIKEDSKPQKPPNKKKKTKRGKPKTDLTVTESEEKLLVSFQDSSSQIVNNQVIELAIDESATSTLFHNGEIKENRCDVEEDGGRKRSFRSAKAKALENILDDALAELTESERNRELSLEDDDNDDGDYDSITTRKNRNRLISVTKCDLDDVVVLAVPETVNNVSCESLSKHCDDDFDDDSASLLTKEECDGGLRRSSRRSSRKTTSYNENDLVLSSADTVDDKMNEDDKLSSDQLFDLLKTAPDENDSLMPKPACTFFNSFDELSSDDFIDSKFEAFDHILENIEDNLTNSSNVKMLDEIGDKKEETIQRMIEAEKIDVGIKPNKNKLKSRKSKKNKKRRNKLVAEDNTVNVSLSDEAVTVESTISSEIFDKSTVLDKSVYCDICNKTFRRSDSLNKHKRTLTHISKLSEIEAREAELKKSSKINDINLFDMLQNVDNNRSNSYSCVDENAKFSIPPDNSSLKLADIINDVLNKPVLNLGADDESSVELKSEFGRLKSLGERKSFDQDESLKTSQTTNYGEITAGTILQKQITLLEDIIENRTATNATNLDYLDDVSSTSFSYAKIEESPLPLEEEKIDNFLKPVQNHYEDISGDCDDNKFRKALNRDEELFLECCSLLKSGSEVSNYSKKSNKGKEAKRLKDRDDVDDDDEEVEEEPINSFDADWNESRVATPLGDRNDSDSNTISSNWQVENNEIVDSGRFPTPDLAIIDSKKMLTKGAMKVFEGLKVSIPTTDLNMDQVFNATPQNQPKNATKKCKRRRLCKDDDDPSTNKIPDVYDFEETLDNSDVFAKPDFKRFRNSLSKCEEEQMSKSREPKTEQNLTKKKCMIMGRIFKNAAKTRADDEIRDLPIVDNAKLVEDFVLNCPEIGEGVIAKPHVMTEDEMNAAFDRLVNSSAKEEIKKPPPQTVPSGPSPQKKKKALCKVKSKKRNRSNSDSTDDEFNLNLKKRKNSKDNNSHINLEQELKECIGVASRKSQRKCTSGKQNVLVEYWSSDESLFEALLESQVMEASNSANRVKSPESAAVPPILDEQVNNPVEAVKKSKPTPKKFPTKETKLLVDNSPTATSTIVSPVTNAPTAITSGSGSRRKRPNPLYHWSSSSEDESCDLIEVKPVREGLDDYDDDEDRPMHHGWIVGDSPKKLVTMLAQAKGKKCDVDGVKELGKKRH